MEERKVRIKAGWHEAGKTGKQLGPTYFVWGMEWTPVIWDDEEDPEFCKTHALEFCE